MKKIALQIAFLFFGICTLSGQQWVQLETGLDTFHDIRFISAIGEDVVWGLAGDYGTTATTKFVTSSDAGQTWYAGTVDHTCSDCYASDLIALDANTAWAIFNGPNRIYKTSDAGVTWLLQSTEDMFADGGSYINIIYFWNENQGIVVGDPIGGVYEIYLTDDGGTTWEALPAASIPLAAAGEYALVGAYGIHGNNFYFGTNKGRIYKTDDFGASWSVVTTPWTTRSISGIAFFNDSDGIAVNGFNNSSNSEVLVTTDGGATWTINAGSSTIPVTRRQGLSVVPGSTYDAAVITGWEGSLYTIDGGANWEIMDDFFHWDGQMTSPTTGWSGGPNGTVYKFEGSLTGVSTSDPDLDSWKVYPNPAASTVYVSGILEGTSDISIRVTDMLGKSVYAAQLFGQSGDFQFKVETAAWTPGAYTISFLTDKALLHNTRLVRIQ